MNQKPGLFATVQDSNFPSDLAAVYVLAVVVVVFWVTLFAQCARADTPAFLAVDRFPKPDNDDYTRWEGERPSRHAAAGLMGVLGLTPSLFDTDDWLIVRAPAEDFIAALAEPGTFAPWNESWYSPEDEGYRLYFAYLEGGSFGDTLSVVAAKSRHLEIPIWRGGRRPIARDRAEKEVHP